MTKEVLISILGIQTEINGDMEDQDEPIEVFSPGTYYLKDGKHYMFYEEAMEGMAGVIKTQIRLKGKETLEVIKKGPLNSHMIFEKNVTHECFYQTPLGELELGIFTTDLNVVESENNISIQAEYTLNVDLEPVAECMIKITVKPQGSEDIYIL